MTVLRTWTLCAVGFLSMLVALLAVPDPASARASTSERRAIDIALGNPDVRERLSLRSGPYDVRAEPYEVEAGAEVLGFAAGTHLRVTWRQDGEPRMEALVDVQDERVVSVVGQRLLVLPSTRPDVLDIVGDLRILLPVLVAFTATLLLGPSGRRRALLAPMLLFAWSYVWVLAGWVDAAHLRTWSIAQYAVPVVAGLWLAMALVRRAESGPASTTPVRMPIPISAMLAIGALAVQTCLALRVDSPIDVAYASNAGATLMGHGLPVYGNMLDITGVVSHGDTYGPLAYLPYVPGSLLVDSVPRSILGTNVVLTGLVAGCLVLTGRRMGDSRFGWWAAAAWSLSPAAMLGGASGHNDVVVALLLAVLVLVSSRPVWRGVLLAGAAATKFLPIVAVAGQLRRRDDVSGAWKRVLLGLAGTSVAVWAIGLGGRAGAAAFAEGVRFQIGRDDIASFWGLAGIGQARLVVLAAAATVVVVAIARARPQDAWSGLAWSTSALALVIVSLPQFWFTYAAWLLPSVLVLAASPSSTFASGDVAASAGRRAGALPSSSGPS